MSTKTVTRALTVLFCLLVIFLTGRVLLPKAAPAAPIANPPPEEVARREVRVVELKVEPERKIVVQKDDPTGKPVPRDVRSAKPVVSTETAVADPDEEFLKRIESLPLDRATLEARLETARRVKTSEKERAKLILSEKKDRKSIIAYAVKQPSMQEISAMTRPFKLLLDKLVDRASKNYVDERYKSQFDHYGFTNGNYRLLYSVIPEDSGAAVIQRSYAASSEEECMEILGQELAPRPPIVIGVTYASRPGQSSYSLEVIPGSWRMDHLVPEELLRPFYNSSRKR